MRGRLVAGSVAALALLALGIGGPGGPARGAETRQITVGTSVASWYHVGSAAPLPDGLPAASPFPAGNLHVAMNAGAESARSYLKLAAGSLPGTVVGGTLILPLELDPASGSLSPESASLKVCLAEDPGPDEVEGGTPPLPPVDCGLSAPAVFTDGEEPTFLADLSAFGDLTAQAGLAVLPASSGAPEANWRVVIRGSQPTLEGGGVRGRLEVLVDPAPGAPTDPTPDLGGPTFEPAPFFAGPPADFAPSFEPLAPPAGLPQAAAPPDPSPSDSGPVAAAPIAFIPDGFSYPTVLLMPLALVAALGWFGTNLTRPALQARKDIP